MPRLSNLTLLPDADCPTVSILVAAYLTWQGNLLEGKGVAPDVEVELPSEALKRGRDPQSEKALETVGAL